MRTSATVAHSFYLDGKAYAAVSGPGTYDVNVTIKILTPQTIEQVRNAYLN